jgi:hypothetical protein
MLPLWLEPLVPLVAPMLPELLVPLWLEPPVLLSECFLLRFLSCFCELPVALDDELPLL